MKALVLRDFGALVVEDRPDPECGPGEVLLRITVTGICGTDLHGFTGENGRRRPGQIMGHETVGRIAATGPDVRLPLGGLATVNPVLSCGSCTPCADGRQQACAQRRVIGVDPAITSAFAEYLVVPETNVVPLPDELPEEYGALVEPLAVGYHAAMRGGCGAGDRVLVVGGGPIGQACVLACLRLGARQVVVSEPDPGRRELCRALGAVPVPPGSDAADESTVELAGRVSEVFGGPATLALDAVGVDATIADCLACTGYGANVVLVGMQSPALSVPAFAVSTGERALIGSFCYSAEEFRSTAEWVGTAPSELDALIERTVDLSAAPATFTDLTHGAPVPGKILVRP